MPVLCSDTPGLDWQELFRELIKGHSWTPRQIAEEMTLPQLVAILGEEPRAKGGQTVEERLEIVNRVRARHGKPPLAMPERDIDAEARAFVEGW